MFSEALAQFLQNRQFHVIKNVNFMFSSPQLHVSEEVNLPRKRFAQCPLSWRRDRCIPHIADNHAPQYITWGTAVAQWLRCCVANRKVAGSIPTSISGIFIGIKFFRSHYGPRVESASNRNEYQEYFLGVKAAGALWRNLGILTSWNLLDPSGPVTGLLYRYLYIYIT